MQGFLLIDKPKGRTSFHCVSVLRRLTGERRIGFAGTLDPLATGLMVLAVGRVCTRELGQLSKLDKVYEVEIEFGKVSDTYDADGNVKNVENVEEIDIHRIKELIESHFTGEKMQVPPAFSAIKVGGKRAYALARQNKEVKLEPRKVIFHEVGVVSYSWPLLVLRIHCGSGTYVRTLAHDLGGLLGCGGYVKELRRLKVGNLSVEEAIRLDDLNFDNVGNNLIKSL